MSTNGSHFSTVEIDNTHVTVKRISRLTNLKIPLHNILSCSKTNKEDKVVLNFAKHSSKKEMVLAKQIVQGKSDFIQKFREEMNSKLKEIIVSRPRRLLVFINPFAGRKNGMAIFNQTKSIFSCAGIQCDIVVTTEPGSIKKFLMESKELYSYDGVISVGGDGTINEIVTGLMIRCQSDLKQDFENPVSDQMPCLLPIGIIPAGTYNALVQFLHETGDPITAALHIAIGRQERSNVYSIHQNGKLIAYAALFFGLGITANTMKTSDSLRCLGRKRYFVSLMIQLLKRFTCMKLKFSYKKCRSCSIDEGVGHSEQEWKVLEGEFHSLDTLLLNSEKNGTKMNYVFGENCGQVMLVEKCNRKNYFNYLNLFKKGHSRAASVNYSFLQCITIKAAKIEFLEHFDSDEEQPILVCDGEIVDVTSNLIDIRLHPRAISLFGCRR